jgi:DNA-directed RNA polymerase II subunit RPB11
VLTWAVRSPVAHPNVPEVLLRIQTDGSKTPKEVLIATIKRIIADLGKLSREFTREYELRKIATAGANQDQADGNRN